MVPYLMYLSDTPIVAGRKIAAPNEKFDTLRNEETSTLPLWGVVMSNRTQPSNASEGRATILLTLLNDLVHD
jgi:hypothetical protein